MDSGESGARSPIVARGVCLGGVLALLAFFIILKKKFLKIKLG